ncbi:MAG: N-acyl homoserine lactonase family protein [Dokdonella sp.]
MKSPIVLAACLALAACSQSDKQPEVAASPAPAPAPAAAMVDAATPAIKLYAMDCGTFTFPDVDAFADDGSMKGIARTFVDPCYLIRHPSGDLIWDTGVPEGIADSPNGIDPKGDWVHIVVKKKLSDQLAELGLKPANIKFVSLSHMHFDHTGNANLFAQSTWLVDADERAAMFSDEARKADDFAGYSALENSKTELIEGDATRDVFGDGSVVIHQAPGHTPGHTVLLVKLEKSGPILLTGDMWHLRESREKRLVPAFNFSRDQTLASMDKVEALAKLTGARIIRQHVPEDFAALPTFPMSLE